MMRAVLALALLLALAVPAQARWQRVVTWRWHPDYRYQVRVLHRLTASEIDERLCRIEWARNHPVGDGRVMILSYEGQLRCARRHHGAMYE